MSGARVVWLRFPIASFILPVRFSPFFSAYLYDCPAISVYTHRMPRYFTLPEANETLNSIRPLINEIHAIRQKVLASQPEIWSALEKSVGNGGNRSLSLLIEDFEQLDALVHSILELGVLIKDINTGLLDFPALREGREVYLCWQYGEGDIAYWHEVDMGYAGRRPIESF
jgi:hypothetical protein